MCVTNSCSCGKGNKCPVAYPTFPGSLTGDNGWSPQLAVVVDAVNLDPDGNSRDVLRLTGWFGGEGTTPTDYVGQYLGTTGFVPLIANGTNIRGARGAAGSSPTGVWTNVAFGAITVGGGANFSGTGTGGTFTPTALTGGGYRYMKIGKTMFMSFELAVTATVDNAVQSNVQIDFSLETPNGEVAVAGQENVGYCILEAVSANVYVSESTTGIQRICHPYNGTDVIHFDPGLINNLGGAVVANVVLRGSIVFEIV